MRDRPDQVARRRLGLEARLARAAEHGALLDRITLPVESDDELVPPEHAPLVDSSEELGHSRDHPEGRHNSAVIRRVGVDDDVGVGVPRLADDLAVECRRGSVGEDPVNPVVDLVGDLLERARRPGESGLGHRVGVGLAVGVAQPGVGEYL